MVLGKEACRVQRLCPFFDKNDPLKWMQNGMLKHVYKKHFFELFFASLASMFCRQILVLYANFKAKRTQKSSKNKKILFLQFATINVLRQPSC